MLPDGSSCESLCTIFFNDFNYQSGSEWAGRNVTTVRRASPRNCALPFSFLSFFDH